MSAADDARREESRARGEERKRQKQEEAKEQAKRDADYWAAKARGEDPPPRSSWDFLSLADVLAGDTVEEEATLLARDDGVCLLYAGKVHSVYGEPECGKTWLALHVCAEQIGMGGHVMYVDFEDGPHGIARRLLRLGLEAPAILGRFHYVRPTSRLTGRDRAVLEQNLLEVRPALVVLDGVTEAMVLHGLDPVSNKDVADFAELLPRWIARFGPAVVELDHVGRNKEQRGRFAMGAQHKLAGVDGAAYFLEIVRPFVKGGGDGLSIVRVAKDRPGDVRQHAPGGKAAELHLRSTKDEVSVELRPPTEAGDFRPTRLMEKVSRRLEITLEPLSGRAVEQALHHKLVYVRLALQRLVEEGYVGVEAGPRRSRLHRSLRPFREENDDA